MKKLLAILLAAILCVGLMAGCGQTTIIVNMGGEDEAEETPAATEAPENTPEPAETAAPVVDDTPLPEGQLKTGLAIVSVVSSSSKAASADADGLAQADTTFAAVLVDGDGVIKDCLIDCVQTKIAVSATGEILTAADTAFDSKIVLDDAYDMRKASPIGAEWDEQANFLADYVTGKTLDEVKGIAIDDGGKPTDADITTGCTMNIAEILTAVENAVANAKVLGAGVDDTLYMNCNAIVSSSSKAASADGDGNAQADLTVGAYTLDASGVITSCYLDCVQAKIAVTAAGEIASEVGTSYDSKLVLDDAYDMRKASPIGAEWDEQANFLADYVTGKTLDEVKGIAIDDGGKPTDADITTGCTMNIAEILTAVENAVANAKVLGAGVDDTLYMNCNAIVSSSSKAASADGDGNAQADLTVGAYTLDASGVITSCYLDCVQAKIAVTAAGEIASEVGTSYDSKLVLDDAYDMRKASPIGAEWDEQAWSFAAYATGKTPADIAGVAVDENGHPTSADITSGCTMNVVDFIAVIK